MDIKFEFVMDSIIISAYKSCTNPICIMYTAFKCSGLCLQTMRLLLLPWVTIQTKIVNKVSQRSLRTNERSIRCGEDLYVSDVTAIYLSL